MSASMREVALRRRRAVPIEMASSACSDVQRMSVGVRVDGDRADAHAPQRANDAAGDVAAIGDENLTKHPASQIRISRGSGCRRCRDC